MALVLNTSDIIVQVRVWLLTFGKFVGTHDNEIQSDLAQSPTHKLKSQQELT